MSDSRASLADVIRKVAAEDRGRAGPPSTLDELARYSSGELTEAEAERVRDDVVLRPESREVVLAFKSSLLSEPPGEEHRISDREIDDEWRRLAAELGIAGTLPKGQAPAPAEKPAPAWTGWRKTVRWWKSFVAHPAILPAAVAASFLLGVFAGPIERRDVPRLNVGVVDLVSERDRTRSEEPRPLNVWRQADPAVWILSSTELTESSAYSVEIVDAGGEVVWSDETAGLTAAGYLTVEVPPDYLAAGDYRLRLYRVQSGRRQSLEDYEVRIVP